MGDMGKIGIEVVDFSPWRALGFSTRSAMIWHDAGFTPAEAHALIVMGFHEIGVRGLAELRRAALAERAEAAALWGTAAAASYLPDAASMAR